MFTSILDDIKSTFRYGNMINRIIIVNVAIFISINLIRVFTHHAGVGGSLYSTLMLNLSLPSDFAQFKWKPWTLFTHMWLHEGFWHVGWNMLLLFWFGRIFGDFLGDRKVLPFYILAGLFGAFVYMIASTNAIAIGASAAVLAFIVAAAFLSPDYIFHLILIGPVRLKYIAMTLVLLDIFGTAGTVNQGGHFGHLGGAIFGGLFIYLLKNGVDLADFSSSKPAKPKKKKKSPLTVLYKSEQFSQSKAHHKADNEMPFQEKLDMILDKIKKEGYDKLTDEEKEFLYEASKKD